jgi:predicted MFS family arabinose efflux permease
VVRPEREGRPSFASLRVGFAYAVGRRDLLGTYLVDLAAMMLAYPMFMLPFVADHFHQTYALAVLYMAMPLGALVASLTSKWTVRVHHYGRAVALAAALWGVGIALFGWTSSLAIAVLGLFWAGAADSISAMFRGTMWNQSIPPDVRDRMASIEMLSYSIGPRVGQFRSGAMTAAFGLRTSLALGGLACAGVCAALPVVLPELWKFDVRSNADVAKVATLRAQEE